MLENLKDRAVVVFGIYLRFSNGFMIELETFDAPHVLRPFEVERRNYDPIDFYSFNMKRLDLRRLFSKGESRARLVLSTSEGRIVVKRFIPIWYPVGDWFKNHLLMTAEINRLRFDGRGYGGNLLFLVDLFKGGDRLQRIPIYLGEHKYKWYQDLGGTEDTLLSAGSVKEMFEEAIRVGKISAETVDVIEAKDFKEDHFKNYTGDEVEIEPLSWFVVNVIGRLATWRNGRALRRKKVPK